MKTSTTVKRISLEHWDESGGDAGCHGHVAGTDSGTSTPSGTDAGKSAGGGQRACRGHRQRSAGPYSRAAEALLWRAPGQSQPQPFEGLGSGVIIDAAKGYILTNNHVVNGADKISVQLSDGNEYDAKLIGHDEQNRHRADSGRRRKNLTQVKIADSDALKVGDFAVAIGNPFGLGQTATSGIISALGRSGLNLEGLENFIQTDAAINRGNSGGALVNLNGELIGINTAILASSGGNIGIGFAIPSNMAMNRAAADSVRRSEARSARDQRDRNDRRYRESVQRRCAARSICL